MRIKINIFLVATLLMLGSALLFTIMIAAIRLASEEVNAFVIVFYRNLFGFIIVGPILYKNGFNLLKTKKLKIFFLRSFVGILAMFTWFHGVIYTPLAEAVALNFTMPLFVIIVAAFALTEKIRWRRWLATFIGFGGTLVVLKPGFEVITFGHLEILLSSLFMAIAFILVKKLSLTEPTNRIVVYMLLINTPIAFIPALFFWEWPSLYILMILILIGVSGTLAHFMFTKSVSLVEITSIIPIDFSRLPMTAIIAYVFFLERPTLDTFIGGLIIFVSTIYILHREIKK
ncbi:MAG: Riboflavin transporter [Alphaproteobacteria bacterium MarineAlpha2_Bin1]|nr:MAG: Riboflavin transporter [Alphaproteobacteria bacterium MarineAlpha2_Bin1]|tara:strand:+ start:296 stop:1156 length:861 start_codon:yes stop_codon:yes gene_type:complete